MLAVGPDSQCLIQKGGNPGISHPPSKSPHTLKNMHTINVYDKLANKQNENI